MLGLLLFARGMDLLSTRFATPTLALEANPLAKWLGWKGGLAFNVALSFAVAFCPMAAVILTTTSLLVASRNFKSAFLMRALGRPHREQIVSVRPAELSTLEAIDLNNGQLLATRLEQGAARLAAKSWASSDEFTQWLYHFALARGPTDAERSLAREALGAQPTAQGIQDLLWAVLMLPEFQLVR